MGAAPPVKPMGRPERLRFEVGRSWSARQVADEAHAFARKVYRDHPDVLLLHEIFQKYNVSETRLWPLLTSEEQAALQDLPLIVVPTGEFNVRMISAPSGNGRFIVFDEGILLELVEFFSAIPSQRHPAWSACVLQGARRQLTGPRLDLASWVEAPLRELKERQERGAKEAPYRSSMVFGLSFCTDFLLAHEFGHHALGHFGDEAHHRKTSHDLEFAADAWAMSVIARLPAFELSSWLLSIELMFWYLNLVDSFDKARRILEDITSPPDDHPPAIARAERLSRLGEKCFEAELDEAGTLPEALFHNLQDRQTLWGHVRKFEAYTPYLAACYCRDPEKTVALHEAIRAGTLDLDAYEAEMKALGRKLRLGSSLGRAKEVLHRIKSKLF